MEKGVNTSAGQRLYKHARCRIPGGTQLLSKRPEMFLPEQWPCYYKKAAGAEVWDLDGNRYIDMSLNGVGACALGHADPDVNHAVYSAIAAGSMATLNCPEEVELADRLCELHPWADQARFARSGGEALAIAVRIARAATGRDKIAFCGYHGWHDWYLAANLCEDALSGHLLSGLDPAGVPHMLQGSALPFRYNRLDELEAITSAHGRQLAAIVMEPLRNLEPQPGFLEAVRAHADRIGAALIFDEATIGFRLNIGGAHLLYDVEPDIAMFAKALSNGFAMAAVIGRAEVMEAAQNTFISSTYWTERIGPAAALAVLDKYQRCNVPQRLIQVGARVRQIWREAAEAAGLRLQISGVPPLSALRFDHEGSQAIRTLFTQELLDQGFLAGGAFYATYAHTDAQLDEYEVAVHGIFPRLKQAIEKDTVLSSLRGPVAHTGFQRLN